jgi:hypothetical protein
MPFLFGTTILYVLLARERSRRLGAFFGLVTISIAL